MDTRTLFVELGIDATNDDILDQMRIMKHARENKTYEHVVCGIRGFGEDRRELWDIPEVRAFCRRVVNLGFISFLDVATQLPTVAPIPFGASWGALEMVLCAEGQMAARKGIAKEEFDEFERVLEQANKKADDTLGPYVQNG